MRKWPPFLSVVLVLLFHATSSAQIQIGTVKGSVTDPTPALVAGAEIKLNNPVTGFEIRTTTGPQGEFIFNNVPFGAYTLHAKADGFQTTTSNISVRSNIPVLVAVNLTVAGVTETINIASAETLVDTRSSSTSTTVDESFIQRSTASSANRQLQKIVATTPGWRGENDGLLHVRGVDDGILYVVD